MSFAEDLNFKKDMYRLRIKTILLAIHEGESFGNYLKKHLELDVPPCDILRNVILDSLKAVEHGIRENDDEIIRHTNNLVVKLESEQGEDSTLAKFFAKLIGKAKNLCEAGVPVAEIVATFEFFDFLKVFKDKMDFAGKQFNDKSEEFYNLMARYSNN